MMFVRSNNGVNILEYLFRYNIIIETEFSDTNKSKNSLNKNEITITKKKILFNFPSKV